MISQEIRHLAFSRRTARKRMPEKAGTVSYSQFSSLSAISLADRDLFVQFFQKSFLPQLFQCRDKAAVACTAGFDFRYVVCQLHHMHFHKHISGSQHFEDRCCLRLHFRQYRYRAPEPDPGPEYCTHTYQKARDPQLRSGGPDGPDLLHPQG